MLVFTGVLALCGFIWFAGPLFAFADYRPLETDRVRLTSIAFILGLFLFWLIVRLWRRKNINAKLMEQLAKVKRPAETESDTLGSAEVKALHYEIGRASCRERV